MESHQPGSSDSILKQLPLTEIANRLNPIQILPPRSLFQTSNPLHDFLVRHFPGRDSEPRASAHIFIPCVKRIGREMLAGIVQEQGMRRGQQGRAFEAAQAPQTGTEQVRREQGCVG